MHVHIAEIELDKNYLVCFPDAEPFVGKVVVKERRRVQVEVSDKKRLAVDPRVIQHNIYNSQ